MTPVEIAYFKHFLFDKNIARIFTDTYRRYRIKGTPAGSSDANPESIESYFLLTTTKDVIMKAFIFVLRRNNDVRFGCSYDYWKEIDDQWQRYMDDNSSNYTNAQWPMLTRTFAILRQNWDLPYYWKRDNFESTEEVYERMCINLPLPEFKWKHGYFFKDIAPKDEEEETDDEKPGMPADNDMIQFIDDNDPFAGFEVEEMEKSPNARLKNNQLSYNNNRKSTCHKITFNIKESDELRKTKMRYAAIASREGDVYLIMNNVKGVQISYGEGTKRTRNVSVGSIDLCERMKSLMDIKVPYLVLDYEKIESSLTRIIFKLIKPV